MTDASKHLGRILGLSVAVLALTACETVPDEGAPYEPTASMGVLIARDSCSECHATAASRKSPNQDAPAFLDIVDRQGMSAQALAAWLKDAHNYPAEMGFELGPHQAESLAAYMTSLQASEPASEQ